MLVWGSLQEKHRQNPVVPGHQTQLSPASAAEAGIRKSLSTVCCTIRWPMSRCLQGRACLLMSLGQDCIAQLHTVAKTGKAFSSVRLCRRMLASLSLSRSDPVSVCPLPDSSSSKDRPLWEIQKTGEAEEHGGERTGLIPFFIVRWPGMQAGVSRV